MGLFKTKQEKEFERKMIVKKTINALRKNVLYLEEQEKKYIEKAKEAIREDLPDQVVMARQYIKETIAQRKRVYRTLLSAEMIIQMKDISGMTKEFLKAVQVLSKQMVINTQIDMSKVQNDLSFALDKVDEQISNLDDMLEDNQNRYSSTTTANSEYITDTELDQLIYGSNAPTSESDLNKQIEDAIKKVSK